MFGKTEVDSWLAYVKDGGILPEKDLRILCEKIKEILIEDSNVQSVSAPVTICGDIRGNFHDLLELFEQGGQIPNSRYLFMGNYVNRGYNSVETFQLLLCLKLKYPDCITLLRGNHETRGLTSVYGFYEENMRKYGNVNAWKYCCEVFDYLGIGAVIEGKIFCIQGGLTPEIKTLDQIDLINRRVEVPYEGPFSDLLNSDPDDIDTWAFKRMQGWYFGSKVTTEFNRINDL